MISFLWSLYLQMKNFCDAQKSTPNNKYLLDLIKRSKVQEKNMSCERGLIVDQ